MRGKDVRACMKPSQEDLKFYLSYKNKFSKFDVTKLKKCFMYFKRQKIESEAEAEDILKTLGDIDSRLKYLLTQMKVPHEKGLQLSEEQIKKYSVQEYVKTAIILLERRIPKDLREYKGDLKVPGIVVVSEDEFKVFEKNARLARDYMQEALIRDYAFVFEVYKQLPKLLREGGEKHEGSSIQSHD